MEKLNLLEFINNNEDNKKFLINKLTNYKLYYENEIYEHYRIFSKLPNNIKNNLIELLIKEFNFYLKHHKMDSLIDNSAFILQLKFHELSNILYKYNINILDNSFVININEKFNKPSEFILNNYFKNFNENLNITFIDNKIHVVVNENYKIIDTLYKEIEKYLNINLLDCCLINNDKANIYILIFKGLNYTFNKNLYNTLNENEKTIYKNNFNKITNLQNFNKKLINFKK